MSLFGSKNKIKFEIEGMTCGHCVSRVTKALEGVESVKSVKVSLEKKEAMVELKRENINEGELIKAVENVGYKVKRP